MDLNAVFFMRPPLNVMYPFAMPRDFHVLLRGKMPPMAQMSPPDMQPPPAHSQVSHKLSPVSPGHRSPEEVAHALGRLPPHALDMHHPGFRGLGRRPSPSRGQHQVHSPTNHSSHRGGGPRSPPSTHTPAGEHSRVNPRDPAAQYEAYKRLAEVQPPRNPNKPLTNFSIADILQGGGGEQGPGRRPSIVRPWDDDQSSRGATSSGGEEEEDGDDEEIDVDDAPAPKNKKGVSPLDALFQMTSKTFDGQDPNGGQGADPSRGDHLSLFTKTQPPKKRRKSRTAFTNHQIYELEKRFLYQKYLTPADKEEIAQSLGLSNAQVITWFQNRRAKLKRDLEELKADVSAAKSTTSGDECSNSGLMGGSQGGSSGPPGGPPVFTSLEELQLFNKNALKKVAESQHRILSLQSDLERGEEMQNEEDLRKKSGSPACSDISSVVLSEGQSLDEVEDHHMEVAPSPNHDSHTSNAIMDQVKDSEKAVPIIKTVEQNEQVEMSEVQQ